jgi:hypothetical protein
LPRHAQPTAALDFDGPSGQRVTLSQLVVAAVRHGMLTFFEACERYDLSLDQFLDWQRTFDEVWPTWDRDRLQ